MLSTTFDPDNRLVAGELELRWNTALKRVSEIEDRLHQYELAPTGPPPPDKALLSSLAQDLPAVWNASTTDPRLKQRIVRILINEVVVDVDEEKHEVILVIHWAGGRHSELRVPKIVPGRHSRCTASKPSKWCARWRACSPTKRSLPPSTACEFALVPGIPGPP
jgi:hypothetical protein